MSRAFAMTLAVAVSLNACSAPQNPPGYTGRYKLDAGTEYVAHETPSSIGGSCEGWNTLEIRSLRDPEISMTHLVCWKREGGNITLGDRTGTHRASGPAAQWTD